MSTKTFSYFVLILLSILKLNATTSNQDSLSKWFIDEIFSKYTNQSQSISVNGKYEHLTKFKFVITKLYLIGC